VTDPWARPANQVPPSAGQPAGEPPTQQIPQRGHAPEPPTQQFPPQGYPPPQNYPPAQTPASGDAGGPPPPTSRSFITRIFRDPLSIILVVVIVVALIVAGVVGAELYARHRADSVVAAATKCVVQDDVSVSFGATPFLLQHMTGHYGNISISTAGNQIRDAKGMKADITIDDIRLEDKGNTKGTIGALNATINWTTEGIKQTIQNSIPLVGSFVTSVSANPSDGTIELNAALGDIITKPQVVDGGIALEVQELTGLGFTLPREAVQPALDAFSSQLTKNLPLGIHADSVSVTDSGVIAKFSTQNATMPAGQEDPCFAGI
jgi:LmeA-like phospholipid-binding